jgi:para-aminobenzoate synthetase component 1
LSRLMYASYMTSFAADVRLNCTPFEVASAFHEREHFAFLDSSRTDNAQGRYSMLAWQPQVVFRMKDADPFSSLDALLRATPAAATIGYFGYDLYRFLEDYRKFKAVDDLGLPDCCLAVYDCVLAFDHLNNQWRVTATSGALLEQCVAEVQAALATASQRRQPPHKYQSGPPDANMTRQQYMAAVRKALEYIAIGDIYQVNLAQRFNHPFEGSPFALFSNLREMSPSFYGAYLNCGDHVVISSSPELFLRREGSIIETRPIKGTRPRGRTKEEDSALRAELLQSKKEAAELTMVVDLERNDLGRICEYGSVEVIEHRYVEHLPTLFHTVSIVRGKLRQDISTIDILKATFPGGSISGCPKIRAVEIIDELEPARRHVYTGAIGFILPNGDLTLNIAIRTLTVAGNRVYYHAGSGIVADSDPELEYEETLHKAAAMQRAVGE